MSLVRILVKIKAVGIHRYGGGQAETAVCGKTAGKGKRYHWYVGYGGDYIPAIKADMPNIEVKEVPIEVMKDAYQGFLVYLYRDRS